MGATRPGISCVVPVWNGEAYLQAALDSIFAQTLPPIEIIVVDDGSSDGSVAVAERNGARVQLIRCEHRGAAAARNHGMAAATGEWIAFLDADDLWIDSKLSRQIAALQAAPDAGCCFTMIDCFVEPGTDAVVPDVLSGDRVGRIASTFLGRRAAIDRIGPMDEGMRIRAEIDWFARFDDAGFGSVVVPDRLARRRLHGRNISRLRASEAVDAAFELIARRRGQRHSAG